MLRLEPVEQKAKPKLRLEPVSEVAEDDLLGQFNEEDSARDLAKRAAAEAGVKKPRLKLSPVEEPKDRDVNDLRKDIIMEFVTSFERGVIDLADFVANPFRVANELVQGRDLPTIREQLKDIGLDVEGGQMDPGLVRDFVRAAGETGSLAGGLKQVKRPAETGASLVSDFLGFGTTTLDDYALRAQKTAQAVAASDGHNLGKTMLTEGDEIMEAANVSAKKRMIEANRGNFDAWKKAEARGDTPTPEVPIYLVDEVQKELKALHNVDPKETLRVIKENGGLTLEMDPDALRKSDTLFQKGARTEDARVTFGDWATLPMADVIRKRVNPLVGGMWERAIETATRNTSRMVESVGKPIARVAKYADENPQFKGALLDLWADQDNIRIARAFVERDLGKKELKAFDTFLDQAARQNREARSVLYKKGEGFDDFHYLHTQRGGKERKPTKWTGTGHVPSKKDVVATMNRTRELSSEMTPARLASYQNPILSHLKFMGDQEHMMQVAKKMQLRPSLGRRSTSTDFFKEVNKKLRRDGIDKERAKAASEIMSRAYIGSQKAPHPAVQSFMNLAYAGTLAQFKSAMLNLQDIFISMLNQGVRPTLANLNKTTKGAVGNSLKGLGIGDQHMGEFTRGFDSFVSSPTGWDWVNKMTRKFTEGSMKYSGFKLMDEIGKGSVLRSALSNARRKAQDGNLYSLWGEVATKDELRKVRPYLVKGTPVEQMPKDVREIVEEAIFTKLGEQQLISIAGRPLAYANHPNARPLYAMSGFAIKQLAMIRRNVIREIKRGNYKKAGTYAGAYALYGGLSYGLLDETRSAIFKDEDFEPEDVAWGILDQMGAVLTMNRLGDTYSIGEFAQDPTEYLLQSVIPPSGLVGALGKDITNMVFKGEYKAEVAKKFPVVGDFYKYYWQEDKPKKTHSSKSENYGKVFDWEDEE